MCLILMTVLYHLYRFYWHVCHISQNYLSGLCYLIWGPLKQTKFTKHLQTRKQFLLFVINKINCDFKFGGLAMSCVEVFQHVTVH